MKKPLILCIAEALDEQSDVMLQQAKGTPRGSCADRELSFDSLRLTTLATVCRDAHAMHEESKEEDADEKIMRMCDDVYDFLEECCDLSDKTRREEAEESKGGVRKVFVDNLRRLHAMLARRNQATPEQPHSKPLQKGGYTGPALHFGCGTSSRQ